MITIKTEEQLNLMRASGKIMKEVFQSLIDYIRPGITTKDIDKFVTKLIVSRGAKPSFLHYMGFPGSVCTSVNDVIVHGIPSDKEVLREGDIVSVDVGVNFHGIHTDACRTYPVGKISKEAQDLIDVTRQSFFEGIKHRKAGSRVGDIGAAIQQFVEPKGYTLVREMQGHGIGTTVHEDPGIPNYGKAGTGVILRKGMCIAIEPMVNAGERYITISNEDGWTTRTRDGKWAAHYENTMLITDDGVELMTL